MKKIISVMALASVLAAGSAFASGYRIPEQSVDSTAKAGADIASASHADATYFNPANMSWLDSAWQVEGDLDYIHLSSINYSSNQRPTSFLSGSTKEENFIAPTLFMVSPDFNNFRFGFSITEPFGLAKRWDDPYQSASAQKFNLQTFDFNPTVSYKINNTFSVAGGVRMMYGTATVSSNASAIFPAIASLPLSRFVQGDATGWGYNLAVSARPDDKSNVSITYRSEIDLDLSGNATLGGIPNDTINTTGKVTVVTPAVLAVSGAYTFFDKLTVELTWDRTFWSQYKNLDFTYSSALGPYAMTPFGTPIAKNWNDSNAYRLGLSYKATNIVTLMAGLAYDETPVPDSTLGFELPDSNAYLFSLGARFQLTPKMDLGVALLYDMKSSRTVTNAAGVNGTFTDASALLGSVGLSYKF